MTNGGEQNPTLEQPRLVIDPERLEWECMYQPHSYAVQACKLAKVRSAMERADNIREQVYAATSMRLRSTTELPDRGIKITEESIKAAIREDEGYLAATKDFEEASEEFYRQTGIVEAWKQRKDMIQMIGGLRRSEMEHMNLHS